MMQSSSLVLEAERNNDGRERDGKRPRRDKKRDFQSLRQVLKVRLFPNFGRTAVFRVYSTGDQSSRYERSALLCSGISFLEGTFSYFTTRVIFLGKIIKSGRYIFLMEYQILFFCLFKAEMGNICLKRILLNIENFMGIII